MDRRSRLSGLPVCRGSCFKSKVATSPEITCNGFIPMTNNRSKLRNINDIKISFMEDVHLTLPPHIFSEEVKSRSMLDHGSVGASSK